MVASASCCISIGSFGTITLSYRQIIHAYPAAGGAYLVTSKNWGMHAGLVAGGSLLVDYMLTVAVSVAAGMKQSYLLFHLSIHTVSQLALSLSWR